MKRLYLPVTLLLLINQLLYAYQKTITTTKDCNVSNQYPNTNLNSDPLWILQDDSENLTYASLIYFDISDLPENAIITSATLKLLCGTELNGDITLRIGRLENKSWSETGVTYNNMPYGETPPEFTYHNVIPDSWNTYDVTEFVQKWFDGSYVNNGFQLFTNSDGPMAYFYNRENSDGKYAPQLVIIYDVLFIDADPNPIRVDHNSGEYPLSIQSNTSWTISENASWLSCLPTSGSNNRTVTVYYQENTSVNSRTTEIIISADRVSNEYISVEQSGITPTLEIVPNDIEVDYQSGNTILLVNSNTSWTVDYDADWLSFNQISGTGNATLTVSYTENPFTIARLAIITITSEGTTLSCLLTQGGNTTGISGIEFQDSILIFPNPVDDVLCFEGLKINSTISIFSISGQKLIEFEVNSRFATINIENIKHNILIIKIKNKTEITYRKILIN